MTPRIYLSAGEPSGDAHAAALVPELERRFGPGTVRAMGGPRLAATGATLVRRFDRLSAMGLVEIVRDLPAHVRAYAAVRSELTRGAYDLVILVDYPGFHLRVARAARRAGVPVLYYIAPQLWAWGAGRARRLRRDVSRFAVILPFEEAFFRRLDLPARFVGHPLLDAAVPSRAAARARLGLPDDRKVLALCPGSRRGEVDRLWPRFRDAALLLTRTERGLEVLVAAPVPGPLPAGMRPVPDALTALAAADAALCKSGTTTLEAARTGTPLVIAYGVHPLTYAVARRVVRVPRIGLVNLVAGTDVAPEFVQEAATPAALAAALRPLLDPAGEAAGAQRRGLATVCAALGRPGAAARVAELARELVA